MSLVRAAASLHGADGVQIFTQSWLPDEADAQAVVVLVHGFGEHSDRYDWVAGQLVSAGYAVYASDHRGHGRSQGPRAVLDVDAVVADVDRLVDEAASAHPGLPVAMLGHSLGGLIAIRYALAHQRRLRALVLSGPLAALDAPPPALALARGLAHIAPKLGVSSLDARLVSRDPAVVAAYRADPLVHHGRIPAQTVAEMARTVERFPDTVGRVTVPTLIVYGTADGLCPPSGAIMLADRFGSVDLTTRAYEGLYHEILNEPEREMVMGDVLGWLGERLG
ncbi:MAG TPA: alpha/beta hydrolase [Solirubrobacteraceae bacterium]